MINRSIKLIKFSLKNYAPFYESMGIKNFQFDRSSSKNKLVLILGANGTGKTYLLSELTPEPMESQTGRISNRFIDNEEGEKVLVYLVDNSIEYTCRIIYSPDRSKTTCYFSKKVGDKVEELNPNGNVGSYLELCKAHLGYHKNYKSIGHISDTIKNVVTMSQAERQTLISTWLPNTEEFLSASKTAQKKMNQAEKEIKSLSNDIAKISFDEYMNKRENMTKELEDNRSKVQLVRDNISKIEVYLSQLKSFTKQKLFTDKTAWKVRFDAYEKDVKSNMELFSKYGKYLGKDGDSKELQSILLDKEKMLLQSQSDEDSVNQQISELSVRIERLQGEINFTGEVSDDILSVATTINLLESQIKETDDEIAKILEDRPEYKNIKYNASESKEFVKIILTTFEGFCSIIGKMKSISNGFSLKDIVESTVTAKLENKIKLLNETNSSIENNIKQIENTILEKERSKIDPGILSFAPKSCSKETCALIAKIVELSKIDVDVSKMNVEIANLKSDISTNNAEIERTKMSMNDVKNALIDIVSINDSIMKINDKFIHLPEFLIKMLNSDTAYIIDNLNSIIDELKSFDEFLSIVDKNETSKESLDSLKNTKLLLSMRSSKQAELSSLLKDLDTLKTLRKEKNDIKNSILKDRDELKSLVDSIDVFSEKKRNLDNERVIIEQMRTQLLKENEAVYYKESFELFISGLKLKEIDYSTKCASLEKDIANCNSQIASRDTLVARKENLETKRKLYELAYNVWNSKTGYPSLVIKDFLSEVVSETNKNLDENWGGLIRIMDFEINEREFRIPVLRGSKILDDVTECSKAEKSTITLALSFAIIRVSSKNTLYNILRIDEADSGFDEVRRHSYLTTIQNDMDMMNCEDAFIITHNQMFDDVQCDVILLKDYATVLSTGALHNKNVIYSFDKVGM